MTFQSTVRQFQTTGIAGEVIREGPSRVSSWILNSAAGLGSTNLFGKVFTKVADHDVQAGGAGAFIGIMVNPKEHALAAPGLTPTDELADGVVAEMLDMGIVIVDLTEAGNVGDVLNWVEASGLIGVGAPGAGEQAIPGAKIVYEDISAPGLAFIQLTN